MKNRWIRNLIIALMAVANFGCGINLYESTANKTTDEALYEEAGKAIDASEWDSAINSLESLSDDFAARPDVVATWAGALAGKCGFDFIGIFNSIGSGDPLMKAAMNTFTGVAVDPASCVAAQAKMEELGDLPSERTSNNNFFMLTLGLGKIGAYLRNDADIDGTDGNGDDSKDATFNACTNHEFPVPLGTPPGADTDDGLFSINELNQIVTGFGLIITNFAAISASLSGDASASLTAIDTACSSIVPNPCNLTDTASVDALTRYTFAAMIHSGTSTTEMQIGIGACNGALAGCCGQ